MTTGKLDDLLPSLLKHNKERYLYAVSDVHNDAANILDRNNINYTKAVMYRTVSNDFQPGEPFDYDMLLFFSPMGIDSLLKKLPGIPSERHTDRLLRSNNSPGCT